jgi:hypothetical protein
MGNYDITRRTAMKWQGVLSDMKAEGTHVICSCSACGWHEVVDLDAMIALLGADGSLWDRRPPCEKCDKTCLFLASPGRGTPVRPCKSWWAFSMDDLPPEAWMGGWTGLPEPPPRA